MSTNAILPRGILRNQTLDWIPRPIVPALSENQKLLRRVLSRLRLLVVIRKLNQSRKDLAEFFFNQKLIEKYFKQWLIRVRFNSHIRKICSTIRHFDFPNLQDFIRYLELHKLQEPFDTDLLHTIFALHFLRRKLLRKCFNQWKNENYRKLLTF